VLKIEDSLSYCSGTKISGAGVALVERVGIYKFILVEGLPLVVGTEQLGVAERRGVRRGVRMGS